MRKALLSTAVAAVLAAGLALAPQALAGEGPYTIAASGVPGRGVTSVAWIGCNQAVVSTPINGVDARVVSAAPYAGKTISISWAATAAAPSPGGLYASFQDSRCVGIAADSRSHTPGTWTFVVPSNARWMVISALGTANVTFRIL